MKENAEQEACEGRKENVGCERRMKAAITMTEVWKNREKNVGKELGEKNLIIYMIWLVWIIMRYRM